MYEPSISPYIQKLVTFIYISLTIAMYVRHVLNTECVIVCVIEMLICILSKRVIKGIWSIHIQRYIKYWLATVKRIVKT